MIRLITFYLVAYGVMLTGYFEGVESTRRPWIKEYRFLLSMLQALPVVIWALIYLV